MVSPEEISMPRIAKHQTMRSNVSTESPKNYYLRILYYPFLDSLILQLNQRFSGYAEAVMRLSSLLPANVVTLNFCEVELAVNLFLSLLQAPQINDKTRFCCCKNFVKIILMLWLRKNLQTLPTGYFYCNKNNTPYSHNTSCVFCSCKRSFSTLRLIKSDIQTTMSIARLDGLPIVYPISKKICCPKFDFFHRYDVVVLTLNYVNIKL